MEQTKPHMNYNPDLLGLIPINSKRVIEVGCSFGGLARAFKEISPGSHYIGVEIEHDYAVIAMNYCDAVITTNIEEDNPLFWTKNAHADCWVFGDTLEHLKDPWRILREVRKCLPVEGCVVASIPNAQHWSVQARLSTGDFRYEDSGLFDRTHLRWFTRKTIIEMFNGCGFEIESGLPRIFGTLEQVKWLPHIEAMAACAGGDPEMAVRDCLPLQYCVRARPSKQ
jgi:SAM-dependent methyltransferase